VRTLLTLLTDIARVAAPAPPGLAFAPGDSILAAALGRNATDDQRARLRTAIDGCLAGDLRALANLADHIAQIAARRVAAAQIDRVAAGLADLLALRTALQAPQASARLQLRQPELFDALRYLKLPSSGGRPLSVLVGNLEPGQSVEFPFLAPGNPLMRRISVAFRADRAEPLLTLNIESGGDTVAWEAKRKGWPQPSSEQGDLRLWLPTLSGTITTRRLESPFTIGNQTIQVELYPLANLAMNITQVIDEANRVQAVFVRSYPVV
jgi:hypothetical protein